MLGSILFVAMGMALFVLATLGMTSGNINTLERFGGSVILQADQPTLFWVLVSSHAALGFLFVALGYFMFWSARAAKIAEERYFRQQLQIQPNSSDRHTKGR